MIREFFQKDNMAFGMFLGLILPLITLGFFYLTGNFVINNFFNTETSLIRESTIQLVCIFTNLFTIRYYLLKVKLDKTGRGILVSTFILAIIYFYNYI